MENPNHPNDPNVLEGEQAPAAPDGFALQWIGEHDPNNNGWIEWDVPLGGELDEPMVDPEVNEEVMDDDYWDDEVEWLMAPMTPPRTTMTVSSTYEIGGPSTTVVERPHGVLVRKMEDVSDVEVASNISIREIHLRVATVGEQIQNQQLRTRVTEMESHMGILMSYMLWMEDRLTVLEKSLPGPPPGPYPIQIYVDSCFRILESQCGDKCFSKAFEGENNFYPAMDSCGRRNQGNQARGRAFMLGAEEARQDPNIMTEPSDLGFGYEIEIASG
nr:hypothetical protein [Tanacetum cinerariifolium]